MFKLRDLPCSETFDALHERYPDLNPTTVRAQLLLARLGHDVTQALETYLARHGLCQGTFFCLMVLNRDPKAPCSASMLAKSLGVSPPVLTSLLNTLESLGYIERRIDSDDRRRLDVRLSQKGRAHVDSFLPACFAALEPLMGRLSASDISALASLLDRLQSAMTHLAKGNGRPLTHRPDGGSEAGAHRELSARQSF